MSSVSNLYKKTYSLIFYFPLLILIISENAVDKKFKEGEAVEKWDRKAKRNNNSYLTPKAQLRFTNVSIKRKHKSIPFMKNGNKDVTRPVIIKDLGKVILTNTCAFDTLLSLLMAGIADSEEYDHRLKDYGNNELIDFARELLQNGIRKQSYKMRAEIIYKMQPQITKNEIGISVVQCESTVMTNLHLFLKDIPSYKTEIGKNYNKCIIKDSAENIVSFNVMVNANSLEGLEAIIREDMKDRVINCYCGHNHALIIKLNMHIFIQVIYFNEGNFPDLQKFTHRHHHT